MENFCLCFHFYTFVLIQRPDVSNDLERILRVRCKKNCLTRDYVSNRVKLEMRGNVTINITKMT